MQARISRDTACRLVRLNVIKDRWCPEGFSNTVSHQPLAHVKTSLEVFTERLSHTRSKVCLGLGHCDHLSKWSSPRQWLKYRPNLSRSSSRPPDAPSSVDAMVRPTCLWKRCVPKTIDTEGNDIDRHAEQPASSDGQSAPLESPATITIYTSCPNLATNSSSLASLTPRN